MTECTCTEVKRMFICGLNRGDGPCLTTAAASEPETATEPLALNSDGLTNTLAAALGATITTTL